MARNTASASSWKREGWGLRRSTGRAGAPAPLLTAWLLLTPVPSLLPFTSPGWVKQEELTAEAPVWQGPAHRQAPATRRWAGECCSVPAQSRSSWFFHCLLPALPTAETPGTAARACQHGSRADQAVKGSPLQTSPLQRGAASRALAGRSPQGRLRCAAAAARPACGHPRAPAFCRQQRVDFQHKEYLWTITSACAQPELNPRGSPSVCSSLASNFSMRKFKTEALKSQCTNQPAPQGGQECQLQGTQPLPRARLCR